MELTIKNVLDAVHFGTEMHCAMNKLLDVTINFPDIKILSAELNQMRGFRVQLQETSWMYFVSALRSISSDAPANYRIPDYQKRMGSIYGVEQSIQVHKLFQEGTCDPEDEKLYRALFVFREVEFICITTKEVCEKYGIPFPRRA